MHNKIFNKGFKVVFLLAFLAYTVVNVSFVSSARSVYENPDNGYEVIIEDDADLLTGSQETMLLEVMKDITEYGSVAFKSIDNNIWSTSSFTEAYYYEKFGTSSGTVFVIDMDNRNIWIYSDGAIYKTITKSYANTITDNVYKYATDGDYFWCANEAYGQILKLLRGQKIAQPMKYICNALLALLTAFFINFIFVNRVSKAHKASDSELLKYIDKQFSMTPPEVKFVNKTEKYDPVSKGGGGSSGGGGGSSGGGGGHSF